MKKLAVLSAVLFLFALAGYSGAVVRSKSNISNNRQQMCRGTVTGEPGHQKLTCSGSCPDGKCEVRMAPDGHGGSRSWCGCGKDEPKECHAVLHTLEGKASAECSARTMCEKKTCKLIESKSGITCDCQ